MLAQTGQEKSLQALRKIIVADNSVVCTRIFDTPGSIISEIFGPLLKYSPL